MRRKTGQTAKTIREALAAVEQEHPTTLDTPTSEIITAKLSLTYQPEIVSRFMRIVEGSEMFETSAGINLNISIPDGDAQAKVDQLVATGVFDSTVESRAFLRNFSQKYTYVNGSGRVICRGVMSDTERTVLRGLANANLSFENAIDELYAAPEIFIISNFSDLFQRYWRPSQSQQNHSRSPGSGSSCRP